MKKTIYACLLLTTFSVSSMAEEVVLKNKNAKKFLQGVQNSTSTVILKATKSESNEKIGTKEFLLEMKQSLPTIYNVVNDYYEAKTCNANYDKLVTAAEIRDFAATSKYGKLIGLYYTNKKVYDAITNSYRFANCDDSLALQSVVILMQE